MKQLPARQRKDQPTTPPPRPLLLPPNPALIFRQIIRKLSRSAQRVYRDRNSELITRIRCQHEARQTSSHSRREGRGQSLGRLPVP